MGIENGGLSILPPSIHLSLLAGSKCFFSNQDRSQRRVTFFETDRMFHLILESLYIPFQIIGPSHHITKLDLTKRRLISHQSNFKDLYDV